MTTAPRAGPWTPRVALALAVLAAAAFIYVTAEIMPVGALSAIARDLQVSEAMVGALLASYALVAAVATMPLVRWTATWPRRRTLLWTLACLSVSQLISALAPTFEVLAVGRVLCAVTHGLMWSVIAPIGARLVPPSHAGRATMAIYVGTGLALVVGSPVTAAMSEMWGWRLAVGAITVASVAVLLAARFALPAMAMTGVVAGGRPRRGGHYRNRALLTLCALTLVGVTAHFISYTFIVVILRDVVGVRGAQQAWLLAAYGVAGLTGMALFARPGDRRPKAAVAGCLAGSALAFAVLATLGFADWPHVLAASLVAVAAIVLWGATAIAMPPMLQAAAMRHSPDDPDGASGLYVAMFQVGIMAGSLTGGVVYEHAGVAAMLTASAALMLGALVCVLLTRGLFAMHPATSEK
ncbi:MFS transporter [Mycolicibacterium sarraceniae]|uniref:Putative MFS-type transporter n=1 Tax=Mycolicibacterium sarraceniae TaxID=1534348 RepID=A0A7I7SRI2_9MYCO|nr:MFS transporter [Mycolicibacterium sarraceniae]BBY58685.1 putative MFS-type transporter [Mycolicibacterium sarraceniae]